MSGRTSVSHEDLIQPNVCNKKFVDARVSTSRVRAPAVHNTVFNGLLVEQSFIHSASVVNLLAKNVVFGPGSSINYSYMENVRLKSANAFLNAIVANTLIANSGFANCTMRASHFRGVSFINVVFSACKFTACTFENCTFSGCMFYKCSFSHNGDEGNFIDCDWRPQSVFGHFVGSRQNWPSLHGTALTKNFFLSNGGKIKFSGKTHGITNTSSDHVEGDRVWMEKFSSFSEPTNLGGNKSIRHAFSKWWNTSTGGNNASSAIPLPAAAGTTKKTTSPVPTKHKLRAYRFTTAGV